MTPRLAVPGDLPIFLELLEEFVRCGTSPGMVWGEGTRQVFGDLFVSYATRDVPGAAAICPAGFCMAGSVIPYDTPWGKTASGWGTYVRAGARGRKLSMALRSLVVNELLAQGFQAIIGSVESSNAAGQASLQPFAWQTLGSQGVALIGGE